MIGGAGQIVCLRIDRIISHNLNVSTETECTAGPN